MASCMSSPRHRGIGQNYSGMRPNACCDSLRHGDRRFRLLSQDHSRYPAQYAVDPRRVSSRSLNGGFMSHRLACDLLISWPPSPASPAHLSRSDRCEPSQPVNVLEVHGTADKPHKYGGGETIPNTTTRAQPQPSETWAHLNHCAMVPEPGAELDSTRAGRPKKPT